MESKPIEPGPARPGTPARSGGRPRAAGRILGVLLLLYLFLVAIALLGAAFKVFGAGFSHALITSTSHPVVGLMIGLLATSVIQSSSSTTSIVVGLVAGGALTVRNAIPIIMGANMGTTVTNTLVAMASMNRRTEFRRAFAAATMHDFFNILTICVLFPLEQGTHYLERTATWISGHLLGAQGLEYKSPLKHAVEPPVDLIKHLLGNVAGLPHTLTGALLLALALVCIVVSLANLTRLMRGIVLHRAEGTFTQNVTRSGLIGMLLGLMITAVVQSSSVTTSLLVPMVGAGVLRLEAAFAVTLGANLGTTVTALLASLAGNAAAVTVALVHTLFNLSGILIFYPFKPLRRIPIGLASALAGLTERRRIYALLYMLSIFFALPLVFLIVSRTI
jgi:sodium-dependent phosphate cotransporter